VHPAKFRHIFQRKQAEPCQIARQSFAVSFLSGGKFIYFALKSMLQSSLARALHKDGHTVLTLLRPEL